MQAVHRHAAGTSRRAEGVRPVQLARAILAGRQVAGVAPHRRQEELRSEPSDVDSKSGLVIASTEMDKDWLQLGRSAEEFAKNVKIVKCFTSRVVVVLGC